MQEIVKCKDCGYLFAINITPYKGRIYTCPKCYSNDHIRGKGDKMKDVMKDIMSKLTDIEYSLLASLETNTDTDKVERVLRLVREIVIIKQMENSITY